jgi:2-oxoglutarate dehydrogenase E1 component
MFQKNFPEQMKDFSYITSSHPEFIENLYKDYLKDPASVDPELKKFFEGFDFAIGNGKVSTNGKSATTTTTSAPVSTDSVNPNEVGWKKELGVYRMILGYRNKGHLIAKTNPIRERKDRDANLTFSFFNLAEEDLDKVFQVGERIGIGPAKLRDIKAHLDKVYAGHVGIEFKYISNQEKVNWLTEEMEKKFAAPLPLQKKKRILEKLNEGVMFEKFLHTKYVGQKRFSLEGGETTIAALDAIINTSANYDVQEVVMGMAHRGRLNVLANILGKTYEQIFSEFEGTAK